MCIGLRYKSNCYIPKADEISNFIDSGYKYILLLNTSQYDVFTMLKLVRERNDGYYLLKATNGRLLVLSKWEFAEHVWDNNRIGWRSTNFGSIKFIGYTE